jgi:hypothetical protein
LYTIPEQCSRCSGFILFPLHDRRAITRRYLLVFTNIHQFVMVPGTLAAWTNGDCGTVATPVPLNCVDAASMLRADELVQPQGGSMVRIGLIFGVAAAIAFTAGLLIPIPCVRFLLAFGSIIALGWGAGYTAAKTTRIAAGQGIGRGAATGAIAGGVVLTISTLAFLVLANTAFFQELFREALQQNPGIVSPSAAQPSTMDAVPAAFISGAGAGFCLGTVNLVLMVIAGAIGGAMWKGVPSSRSTNVRA